MKIGMEHGSGGKETSDLIANIFAANFNNPVLSRMEDSATVDGYQNLAITTDSFVVTPLFFNGGDIGKLAICGTVNDLSMVGATPKYITCGFILETGALIEDIEKIAKSMAKMAKASRVTIVAGDTKVIEGNGGIYINTSGVGFLETDRKISSSNCKKGDKILLSGTLGDHHAAILSARMNIKNNIQSDCAPLNSMTLELLSRDIEIMAMRDVTRGGLATVLNEISTASNCCISLRESQIPVSESVKGFCGILGLDPLYMGNEGKMIAVVAKEDAIKALDCMRKNYYGKNASIIGEIAEGDPGNVIMETTIGGKRLVTTLYGEGLPRIC